MDFLGSKLVFKFKRGFKKKVCNVKRGFLGSIVDSLKKVCKVNRGYFRVNRGLLEKCLKIKRGFFLKNV